MRVNPYNEPLLRNITDLLNQPPVSPEDLKDRWCAGGMPLPGRPTHADLEFVLEYLRDWAVVVSAADPATRVEALNRMLTTYTAPPSITDHDGTGWHLHFRDPAVGFGPTLAGATTAAAAQYLCDRGMGRVGRCACAGCGRAFVDFSRPGQQRYCTHACANRDAVRRHRSRSRRGSRVPDRQR